MRTGPRRSLAWVRVECGPASRARRARWSLERSSRALQTATKSDPCGPTARVHSKYSQKYDNAVLGTVSILSVTS